MEAAHDRKRILIQTALDTLQQSQEVDERDSLQVETWIEWYDATIPLVTEIEIIAGAMKVDMAKRRGMRLAAEPESRGRPSSQEIISPGETISHAARLANSRDRALGREPAAVDAYVRTEAKAGRVPTRKGALRHVQRMHPAPRGGVSPQTRPNSRPTGAMTDAGHAGRLQRLASDQARVIAALDLLSDGTPRTDRDMLKLTGMDITKEFLKRVRLIPWLTIHRTLDATVFTIDPELRAICEGRIPRPALDGFTLHGFLRHLRAEIIRRRKENNDARRQARWSTDQILTREQTDLLNWIETELDRVPA